jgi:hypothetical protein
MAEFRHAHLMPRAKHRQSSAQKQNAIAIRERGMPEKFMQSINLPVGQP